MNYQNMPALNKYTSPIQYEALVEIDKTNSIVPLLMKGSSSKTVGALIRSAWVQSYTFTDEGNVMREGWRVTEHGKHAMTIYEAKMEERRREAERQRLEQEQTEREEKVLFDLAVEYFRAKRVTDAAEQAFNAYGRKSSVFVHRRNFLAERARVHVENHPSTESKTNQGETNGL